MIAVEGVIKHRRIDVAQQFVADVLYGPQADAEWQRGPHRDSLRQRVQIADACGILLDPESELFQAVPERKFQRSSVELESTFRRLLQQRTNSDDVELLGSECSPKMAVEGVL